MKKGDKIQFKKIRWVLIKRCSSFFSNAEYWKYKVYRRYGFIWLNNTKCTYDIAEHRWERLKKELDKDKNFHYTQAIGFI